MKNDIFITAYIEAALWSSTDENDHPLDQSDATVSDALMASFAADCESFQKENAELLEAWYAAGETLERAGHDFWLTRNRHGAGFWDRWSGGAEGEIGRKLTDAAHACGEVNLYAQDGEIFAD